MKKNHLFVTLKLLFVFALTLAIGLHFTDYSAQAKKQKSKTQKISKTKEGFVWAEYTSDRYEGKKGIAILNYSGNKKIVKIPEKINGKRVIMVNFEKFNNKNITNVTLSKHVREFNYDDYYETDPDISQNYKNIFNNCPKLKSIGVVKSNKYLSSKNGILYNKSKTILYTCPLAKKGSVKIPSTVKTIDRNAFMGCKKITSIAIPASVHTISEAAFGQNDKLKKITTASKNPNLKVKGNLLLSKNGETLYAYTMGSKKQTCTIPNGVKTIKAGVSTVVNA